MSASLFGGPADLQPLNQCLQSFTAWVGMGVEAGDGLVVVESAQRRHVTGVDALGREGAGVGVLWGLQQCRQARYRLPQSHIVQYSVITIT